MEKKEIKLKIEAFTPETIPMLRLGEYMAEFAKLLANHKSVHFQRLETGSTVVAATVEYEDAPKVRKRLGEVQRSEAPKDAIDSFSRLNAMLREDNAVGRVLLAANDNHLEEALYLAGREIPMPRQIGPLTEPVTIKAQLYRIGGRDQSAHAQMVDGAGRNWNGILTQEQAANMASAGGKGLYRWFLVHGQAKWIRTDGGEWEVKEFRITDFSPLPEDSLSEEVKKLRDIEGNQWAEINDPIAFIRESRNGDIQ